MTQSTDKNDKSPPPTHTFYLHVSSTDPPIWGPNTIVYKVNGEKLAKSLCRLCTKEYTTETGLPKFIWKSAGAIPQDDQLLLDESLEMLNVYDDPDPGIYDPQPSKETILRAQYARRVQAWEGMLARRAQDDEHSAQADVDGIPPPQSVHAALWKLSPTARTPGNTPPIRQVKMAIKNQSQDNDVNTIRAYLESLHIRAVDCRDAYKSLKERREYEYEYHRGGWHEGDPDKDESERISKYFWEKVRKLEMEVADNGPRLAACVAAERIGRKHFGTGVRKLEQRVSDLIGEWLYYSSDLEVACIQHYLSRFIRTIQGALRIVDKYQSRAASIQSPTANIKPLGRSALESSPPPTQAAPIKTPVDTERNYSSARQAIPELRRVAVELASLDNLPGDAWNEGNLSPQDDDPAWKSVLANFDEACVTIFSIWNHDESEWWSDGYDGRADRLRMLEAWATQRHPEYFKDKAGQGVGMWYATAVRALADDLAHAMPDNGSVRALVEKWLLYEPHRQTLPLQVDGSTPPDVLLQTSAMVEAILGVATRLERASQWTLKATDNPTDYYKAMRDILGSESNMRISNTLRALAFTDDMQAFDRRTLNWVSVWRDWHMRADKASERTSPACLKKQQTGDVLEPRHVFGNSIVEDFQELCSICGEVAEWLRALAGRIATEHPGEAKDGIVTNADNAPLTTGPIKTAMDTARDIVNQAPRTQAQRITARREFIRKANSDLELTEPSYINRIGLLILAAAKAGHGKRSARTIKRDLEWNRRKAHKITTLDR